ncbi:hypothetical protein I4F81_001264 [Pyropia yezoensis]|uniref:Uncharacterized protein n=1 Tax=Pyropia yezoensis TaxID=2788 RepID=A0ACC3BM54_PYRYE|nr:hypothetical protein I4F81_001264 [Neopyropia yezoensis]
MPDCAVHVLDPVSAYASAGGASPTQRVATIVDAACASTPLVLYLPQVDQWSGNEAACLWAALEDVPLAHRLLVLATEDEPWMELSTQLAGSFAYLYTDLSDEVNALPADVINQDAFAHLRRAAMRLGESRARVTTSRLAPPAAVSNETSGSGHSAPAGQFTAAAASDPPPGD